MFQTQTVEKIKTHVDKFNFFFLENHFIMR